MYALFLLLALPTVGLSSEATVDDTLLARWTVVQEESVFAAVTQKEGFAARLAHNHLIVARAYSARLDFDPENPDETEFELKAQAPDLIVDDPEGARALGGARGRTEVGGWSGSSGRSRPQGDPRDHAIRRSVGW